MFLSVVIFDNPKLTNYGSCSLQFTSAFQGANRKPMHIGTIDILTWNEA